MNNFKELLSGTFCTAVTRTPKREAGEWIITGANRAQTMILVNPSWLSERAFVGSDTLAEDFEAKVSHVIL